MTVHFTVPKWLGKTGVSLVALLGMFLVSADWCSPGSNGQEQQAQSNQQQTYDNAQPIPHFPYSNYRQALIQLQTQLATGTVTTWTVWGSYSGPPEKMCKSQGWPIPVNTQLSNPQQITDAPGGSTPEVVGQMDPFGVYSPPSGLGTWVMCLDAAGVAHPVYAEGVVTAYPWAVAIENGKVVDVGQPDASTAVKPCQYDAATKKCQ